MANDSPKQGYSGYKREDVGSGWGKMAAGPIGHFVGKAMVERPKGDIDERKKSHRIGVIASEQLRAKRIAKGLGIGGAIGGAGAALASKAMGVNEEPDYVQEIQELTQKVISEIDPALIGAGIGGGAYLGAVGAVGAGGYKAAKKLGYGKAGKLAASVPGHGVLAGLARPKKLDKDK